LAGSQRRGEGDSGLAALFAAMTEEELDGEFDQARYISSTEERNVFDELDKAGKARFLSEFWQRRDSNPATVENEYRERYLQLLAYADEHFATRFRPGWESDRGRVLLVYGPPSEIERSRMERGSKPYEVWSYNELEGGSIFVFADISGFGEYQLLHSSYSKELSQPDWERLILRRQGSEFIDPVGTRR
jgi:GWxTD domain-containing protein